MPHIESNITKINLKENLIHLTPPPLINKRGVNTMNHKEILEYFHARYDTIIKIKNEKVKI